MFKMKIKLVVDKATTREELLGFGAFFNKLATDQPQVTAASEMPVPAEPTFVAPTDPAELPEPEQTVEPPKADPDPAPTERRRRRTKAEMEALRAELATKATATEPAATDPAATDPAATEPAATEPAAATVEENEDFSFGAVNMLAVQCSKTFGPAKVREIIRASGGNMLRDLDDLGLMNVAGELKKLIAGE